MKKWISILAGLLVAQLVMAVAVNMGEQDYGAFVAKEKLLAFDEQKVDRLTIEDGNGAVTLDHSSGKWVLPDEGDFPAAQKNVETVLDKLSGLEKGWPVATTTSASRRFKVAEDEFERKLTLYSGDEVVARLYVGTSPGFRKVHLRPDDEGAVFVAEFNTWEVDAQADGWIDKEILKLDQADLEKIEITGKFSLSKQQEDIQVVGLGEQESTNLEEARNLMNKLSDLRIQSLVNEEKRDVYQDKDADLQILVMLKDGKQLNYQFFKAEGESHYILKRSDRDRYFQVAAYMVDPLKEVSREKLVVVKESRQEATTEIKTSQNEIE